MGSTRALRKTSVLSGPTTLNSPETLAWIEVVAGAVQSLVSDEIQISMEFVCKVHFPPPTKTSPQVEIFCSS
jgi:hypothetical protein